ncbi:hypothetical protein CBR_g42137 [Chara braunii]|uniref:Uncharacterized protein n=1 Tax=Chara braunii TaxID=69332 RepID=A0A388LX06_CHABU|nr:hypothetical protein CBR_g42137 [Chara braunii]|eukprot:GBG86854.1 hypothetical protein CBR_g42137 [Chara braunii]
MQSTLHTLGTTRGTTLEMTRGTPVPAGSYHMYPQGRLAKDRRAAPAEHNSLRVTEDGGDVKVALAFDIHEETVRALHKPLQLVLLLFRRADAADRYRKITSPAMEEEEEKEEEEEEEEEEGKEEVEEAREEEGGGEVSNARLCGGRWVKLIDDGHPGLIEVKWCRNRFTPFLVIDPEPDAKPRRRDAEEFIEVLSVDLETLQRRLYGGQMLPSSIISCSMAISYLQQSALL